MFISTVVNFLDHMTKCRVFPICRSKEVIKMSQHWPDVLACFMNTGVLFKKYIVLILNISSFNPTVD